MQEAITLAEERPVAQQPAHVPDHLVYDFDFIFDPALAIDPHQRVLEIAKEAPPIFWTPRQGGHWVIAGHTANFEAARTWRVFSSEMIPPADLERIMASLPPGTPRIPQATPLTFDPPKHSKYRAPLNPVFAPSVVSRMLHRIRTAAEECVEAVVSDGHCDFMTAIAERLPVEIFLKMMGLPTEKRTEYQQLLKDKLAGAGLSNIAKTSANLIHIASVMQESFADRKAAPQDDIISLLWSIEFDGRPITLEEMEDYGVTLFMAGLDTVMNAMGYIVLHLAQHPQLQDAMRADPSKIDKLVEELLRLYTFVTLPRRITEDHVFEGVTLKAGERAMLYLPTANVDASEFTNPERCEIERENRTHLAFNAGSHRCVGLHLARAELIALCEVLFTKMPPFRLAEGGGPTYRISYTLGIETLPIEWAP